MIDEPAVPPRSVNALVREALRIPRHYPLVLLFAIIYQYAATVALRFCAQRVIADGTDVRQLLREMFLANAARTEVGNFQSLRSLVELRDGLSHSAAPLLGAGITIALLHILLRTTIYGYCTRAATANGAELSATSPTTEPRVARLSIASYVRKNYGRLIVFELWALLSWFFYVSAAFGLVILLAIILQIGHGGPLAFAAFTLIFLLMLLIATPTWALLIDMARVRCVSLHVHGLEALSETIAGAGARIWSIAGFAMLMAIFSGIATFLALMLAKGLEHFFGGQTFAWHPAEHIFTGIIFTCTTCIIFGFSRDAIRSTRK